MYQVINATKNEPICYVEDLVISNENRNPVASYATRNKRADCWRPSFNEQDAEVVVFNGGVYRLMSTMDSEEEYLKDLDYAVVIKVDAGDVHNVASEKHDQLEEVVIDTQLTLLEAMGVIVSE